MGRHTQTHAWHKSHSQIAMWTHRYSQTQPWRYTHRNTWYAWTYGHTNNIDTPMEPHLLKHRYMRTHQHTQTHGDAQALSWHHIHALTLTDIPGATHSHIKILSHTQTITNTPSAIHLQTQKPMHTFIPLKRGWMIQNSNDKLEKRLKFFMCRREMGGGPHLALSYLQSTADSLGRASMKVWVANEACKVI